MSYGPFEEYLVPGRYYLVMKNARYSDYIYITTQFQEN